MAGTADVHVDHLGRAFGPCCRGDRAANARRTDLGFAVPSLGVGDTCCDGCGVNLVAGM